MNSEQIVKITADLAVATKLLAQVAEQLVANSCSLNGLEITGINEHNLVYLKSELDNPENQKIVPVPAEDMGLVKNLDILPPVEIREKQIELNDDDIWDIALASGINFEEAIDWFKDTFVSTGSVWTAPYWFDSKKLILAYTREYLRNKK